MGNVDATIGWNATRAADRHSGILHVEEIKTITGAAQTSGGYRRGGVHGRISGGNRIELPTHAVVYGQFGAHVPLIAHVSSVLPSPHREIGLQDLEPVLAFI